MRQWKSDRKRGKNNNKPKPVFTGVKPQTEDNSNNNPLLDGALLHNNFLPGQTLT